MKNILFILSAILLIYSSSQAQTRKYQPPDSTIKYRYFISFGGYGQENSAVYSVSYSFSLDKVFYKAGYLTKGSNIFWGKRNSKEFYCSSFALSVGYRIKTKWLHITPFIGPALVYGPTRKGGLGSMDSFNEPGVQLETLVSFRISKAAGIGVGLYGNWNIEENFSGINILIDFGNGK